MDLFMRGGLDAVSAMWYNEYHTLMSYGLDEKDMVVFPRSGFGFSRGRPAVRVPPLTARRKSPAP